MNRQDFSVRARLYALALFAMEMLGAVAAAGLYSLNQARAVLLSVSMLAMGAFTFFNIRLILQPLLNKG